MKCFLILTFSFYSSVSLAQNGVSDLTENFAYAVKSIDDFIDRFDYVRGTEFEEFFHSNHPDAKLSRSQLLLSLFNFKNKSFRGNHDIMSFIETVTDSMHPEFINFSDSSWYAEAEC